MVGAVGMCKNRFSLEDQGFRSVYKYVDNSGKSGNLMDYPQRDFQRGLHKNEIDLFHRVSTVYTLVIHRKMCITTNYCGLIFFFSISIVFLRGSGLPSRSVAAFINGEELS